MNLVGLYFFSFLICGHLLKKGIKNSRHRYRCDCKKTYKNMISVYEEQSLSTPSQGCGYLLDLFKAPFQCMTIVFEGLLGLCPRGQSALDFTQTGVFR